MGASHVAQISAPMSAVDLVLTLLKVFTLSVRHALLVHTGMDLGRHAKHVWQEHTNPKMETHLAQFAALECTNRAQGQHIVTFVPMEQSRQQIG
jgi:hypothetical protein